jgi:hypothetical protein
VGGVDVFAYLVEELSNFSKVRRLEVSWFDSDDLSAKVGESGRVGRRGEC